MRVLVTGAAGFVGSHVVDHLVAEGHDVVALDRRPPADDRRNPAAAWVTADLRDPEAWLTHVAAGIEAISHQAAMVGLGVDLGDVCDYVADNDGATAAGLWALHQLGWRGRFVLASSMVVYGEGCYRCFECSGGQAGDPRPAGNGNGLRPAPRRRDDLEAGQWEPRCPSCDGDMAWEAIDEDSPTDPRNVYAATKLHQEHLVAAFAREQDLDAIALRYHNIYGPRLPLDTPYAGVAALFRARLAAGEPALVFEDGGQTRDFVHVHDVARANVAALAAIELGCRAGLRTYNVASGVPTTVLGLAQALSRVVGGPAPRVVGGYRLGDVRHVVASPAKAFRDLGFRAEVGLDAGLHSLAPARPTSVPNLPRARRHSGENGGAGSTKGGGAR